MEEEYSVDELNEIYLEFAQANPMSEKANDDLTKKHSLKFNVFFNLKRNVRFVFEPDGPIPSTLNKAFLSAGLDQSVQPLFAFFRVPQLFEYLSIHFSLSFLETSL